MRKRCPVCSCRVTGFPCEVCGHDARTRPAPPKAPPDREGVPIPAGVLGHPRSSVGVRPDSAHFDLLSGETFVSISGPGFSFPRLRVARKPDGSGFDLFDEAPATPAPFNPAHQGGLHRWPR